MVPGNIRTFYTNSMEQNPSWEAGQYTQLKKFPVFQGTRSQKHFTTGSYSEPDESKTHST
jgi:hypothetical protein